MFNLLRRWGAEPSADSSLSFEMAALVFTAVLLHKATPGIYPDEHWARAGVSVAERFFRELRACERAAEGRRRGSATD